MTICEFCAQFRNGKCWLGLNIPKSMSCAAFDPAMERFCSDRSDFVNAGQIIQMANFFGIKGREMKKIKVMAKQEEMRLKTVDA
jgi:hypothetical protein